jgi:hypothetical protein
MTLNPHQFGGAEIDDGEEQLTEVLTSAVQNMLDHVARAQMAYFRIADAVSLPHDRLVEEMRREIDMATMYAAVVRAVRPS